MTTSAHGTTRARRTLRTLQQRIASGEWPLNSPHPHRAGAGRGAGRGPLDDPRGRTHPGRRRHAGAGPQPGHVRTLADAGLRRAVAVHGRAHGRRPHRRPQRPGGPGGPPGRDAPDRGRPGGAAPCPRGRRGGRAGDARGARVDARAVPRPGPAGDPQRTDGGPARLPDDVAARRDGARSGSQRGGRGHPAGRARAPAGGDRGRRRQRGRGLGPPPRRVRRGGRRG